MNHSEEIVHLQCGTCGNRIGKTFWEQVCKEHEIGVDGERIENRSIDPEVKRIERTNVHFCEADGSFHPRCILFDLKPQPLDSIQSGRFGKLFKPENYVCGKFGGGGNFASGFYGPGRELQDELLDVVRKEAEQCDNLTGFQMTHSICGGTGSGLGTFLNCRIREEYPDRMFVSYTLLPSSKLSTSVLEWYNATLGLHNIHENVNLTICLDNKALFDYCIQSEPNATSFTEMNKVVANLISGVTSSVRFPNESPLNYRKMGINMIHFPRQHHLTPGYSSEIKTDLLYSKKCTLVDMFDPKKGKSFGSCVFFRRSNHTSTSDYKIVQELSHFMKKSGSEGSNIIPSWVPNNISWTVSRKILEDENTSNNMSFIHNCSSIGHSYKAIQERFRAMFKKKAFVHMYTSNGMDEMEFTEAESNLLDIHSEYFGSTRNSLMMMMMTWKSAHQKKIFDCVLCFRQVKNALIIYQMFI